MTEPIMNALKQIREATAFLMEKTNDPLLSRADRIFIEHSISILDQEEDVLITHSLEDMITELNVHNDKLHTLIDSMATEAQKIQSVSDMVKKIATVIGVLTEIAAKGISAGLINPSSLRKTSAE